MLIIEYLSHGLKAWAFPDDMADAQRMKSGLEKLSWCADVRIIEDDV